MLTQGVTTEILNPDGGGPLDIGQQLSDLEAAGLALNVGAFEEADPAVPARAMILVEIEGMPGLRGSFDRQRLSLTHGEPGTR